MRKVVGVDEKSLTRYYLNVRDARQYIGDLVDYGECGDLNKEYINLLLFNLSESESILESLLVDISRRRGR